jgi:protein gp37
MLDAPLRWRKSRRVFVNSMSDLFHRDVPFEFIAAVFGVMAACPQHTFQLLTKRPERAREWFAWVEFERGMARPWAVCAGHARRAGVEQSLGRACLADWGPLPNVQLLVSVEDQVSADERISILLDLPATVRGVSYEPALGEVDFYRFLYRDYPKQPDREHLDWIVVGGESGPGARPFDLAWPRSTIMQCKAAGVPCFIKQLGAKPFVAADEMAALLEVDPFDFAEGLEEQGMPTDRCFCMLKDSKGADMSEWPEDLRVREFPS